MLRVTVLGSGMAFLEATVVNVALPEIGEDLDADIAGLQWTINGYLLTLAALILLGGSLGDHYGRRRKVFSIGVVWFRQPRSSAQSRRTSRCWSLPVSCRGSAAPC